MKSCKLRLTNWVIMLFSVFLALSCSEKKHIHEKFVFPKLLEQKNNFSHELYFLGPQVDSTISEIRADCDCCASDLAFLNDSVFVYVVKCMGGDSFLKGKYMPIPFGIILKYDKEYVDGEETIGAFEEEGNEPDFGTKYVLRTGNESSELLPLSQLNSKWVITQKFDDGSTLYGMKNANQSLNDFENGFKSKGLWKMLKL